MNFRKKCEAVTDLTGCDVAFFDDNRPAHAFEDDGYLHVVHRGIRACFSVCQSDDAAVQNGNTKHVLKQLGMEKYIGENTLVDESDEDEGVCPHCGEKL